jgi:hypothetical protein
MIPRKKERKYFNPIAPASIVDGLARSLLDRHPDENRGPEHLELNGFRLSPE